MGSYDDLRNVIDHIAEETGDKDGWKTGLTDQQVRDVNGWLASDGAGYKDYTDPETGVIYEDRSGIHSGHTPQVPDDALDRIRGEHPGLFDPTTKAPTVAPTNQPANQQQGNAGANNNSNANGKGGEPAAAPVPTEAQNKGDAAKAAKKLEDKLQDRTNKATDADRELAQAVLNAHATTAEGAKRLNDIQSEITAAVNSATALDTPMGAREFSKFLNSKLAEISDVVKTASLDAASQKAVLAALADFYSTRNSDNTNNGGQGNNQGQGGGQGGDGGQGGGQGGGGQGGDLGGGLGDFGGLGDLPLEGGGGDPLSKLAESTAPALQSGLGAAAQIPSQLAGIPAQLAGMGSSIPGMFGGNGTGRGGDLTDPFKTDKKPGEDGNNPFDPAADAELAGLFGNEPPPGDNNDGDDNKDDDKKDGKKDGEGEPKPGEPVNNPNAPGVVANANGPTPVTIDGVTYTADNPKLAAAVTDISKGTPPLEAFRKHDIAIAPPTSPPATPLGPEQLRFGSYGTYTNGDIVVVLDKQRAIIDGEVQPVSSAASKPGFLAWQNPPAPTGTTTTVAAAPAAPAAPSPTAQAPFAPVTQTSAKTK